MKYIIPTLILILLTNCTDSRKVSPNFKNIAVNDVNTPKLNLEQANRLAELPLACKRAKFQGLT